VSGWGGVVGVETNYQLDGLVFDLMKVQQMFLVSNTIRLAEEPAHPAIQWEPGFRRVKRALALC